MKLSVATKSSMEGIAEEMVPLPIPLTTPTRATPLPLSSRPKRTRISYFALLATTTCAALRKESRMQIHQSHGSRQEIRGSVVEGSAVRPAALSDFSPQAIRLKVASRPLAIRNLVE
jgi:hypothetical protein